MSVMNRKKRIKQAVFILDWEYLILTVCAVILPILLKDIGVVIVYLYLWYGCVKKRGNGVLLALMLSMTMRFLNPALYEGGIWLTLFTILTAFGTFAVALNQASFEKLLRRKDYRAWLWFGLFALISSFVTSHYLAISILKWSTWMMTFWTIALAMSVARFKDVEKFLYNYFIVIVGLSLLTLSSHGIAYWRNGTGFQGVTKHPQYYGSLLALFLSYLSVQFLYARERFKQPWIFYLLFLGAFVSLVMTHARTGMFTFVLSVLASISLVYVSSIDRKRKKKALKYLIPALFLILVLVVWKFDAVKTFAYKSQNAKISDRLDSSRLTRTRAGLAEASMYNFKRSPIIGNGFAAPSGVHDFKVKYLPGTSIPISASIEKGVIVFAVLEEGGIIGFALFIFAIWTSLLFRIQQNVFYSVALLAPLLSNMGDFTFFSMNGAGPMMMIFLMLAPSASCFKRPQRKRGTLKP